MRYAAIDNGGLVVGIIIWDGEADYTPAGGITLVQVPDGVGAGPSWTYDGTDWIAPPVEDEDY